MDNIESWAHEKQSKQTLTESEWKTAKKVKTSLCSITQVSCIHMRLMEIQTTKLIFYTIAKQIIF